MAVTERPGADRQCDQCSGTGIIERGVGEALVQERCGMCNGAGTVPVVVVSVKPSERRPTLAERQIVEARTNLLQVQHLVALAREEAKRGLADALSDLRRMQEWATEDEIADQEMVVEQLRAIFARLM